jgi:AraC-like DNA-binding protein
MNYVIIIGIIQSLLALMFLKISTRRRPVYYFLFWLLACICVHLCIKLVIYTWPEGVAVRKAFNTFLDLAYGPLLWMIARKVQDDRYRAVRHWYLFLPTFLAGIAYLGIAGYIFVTGIEPVREINLYNSVTIYFISSSLLVFPVFAYRIAKVLPLFWATEKKFLINLVRLFLVSGLLCITGRVLSYFMPDSDSLGFTLRFVGYSLLIVESIVIARYLFKLHAELDAVGVAEADRPAEPLSAGMPERHETPALPGSLILSEEVEIDLQPANTIEGVQKSLLPVHQQQEIISALERLMSGKKPYTDLELNLDKLSVISKIPKHHITESLHRHAGSSFSQFVNQYRVQEVIISLDRCRRFGFSPNILSLAYEAGFNSKSTFNYHFKKITGCTPSAYLKKQHEKPQTLAGENAYPDGFNTSSGIA